jgi:hypothetical protein
MKIIENERQIEYIRFNCGLLIYKAYLLLNLANFKILLPFL